MVGLLDVYTGITNILNLLKSPDVQKDVNLVLKGLGELGLMKAMTKAMAPMSPVKEEHHEVVVEKA
jgi:hypothetical protein